MTDQPESVDAAPQAVSPNMTLTFKDIRGHLWFAAGVLGSLVPEDADDPELPVTGILAKGLVLTGVQVVNHD